MEIRCLTLNLKDRPELIREYRRLHMPENIWPEVTRHIETSGVLIQKIFLLGTRLVMVLIVPDEFDPAEKQARDSASPVMQKWEREMEIYQERLSGTGRSVKWVEMEEIHSVKSTSSPNK